MRHPVPIARDQEIHSTSIPNECVLRLIAPPATLAADGEFPVVPVLLLPANAR
jgi:hypothetical protein